jgi:hypothetical protein
MYAILNLVTNTIMTGFAVIGIGTVIIKVGNFFKIIEENTEDSFKKGFDKIMLESIEEMNTCVESISIITNNFNKIFFTLYDIVVGNKYIKKDKNGKIIICTKTKLYSGFKNKIEELNSKVKKYQNELNKIKKNKDNDKNKKKDDDDDSLSDDSTSDNSSFNISESSEDEIKGKKNINDEDQTYSDVSSDELSDNDDQLPIKITKKKKSKDDEDFYLEES